MTDSGPEAGPVERRLADEGVRDPGAPRKC